MKKFVLALSLIGPMVGSAIVPAMAQEADFATVDANGDGMVSMEEATNAGWAWTEDQFKAADSDGDGGLNADEFAAATA